MSVLFLQLRWRVSAARLLVIAPQTVRALMRRAPHLDATHFVLLYLQRASVRREMAEGHEEGHRKGGKANSELAIKIFNCNLISWCADMESLTISSWVSLQLSLFLSVSLLHSLSLSISLLCIQSDPRDCQKAPESKVNLTHSQRLLKCWYFN